MLTESRPGSRSYTGFANVDEPCCDTRTFAAPHQFESHPKVGASRRRRGTGRYTADHGERYAHYICENCFWFRWLAGVRCCRWRYDEHCECFSRKREAEKMSDRITVDPLVCHGKPCIRGLRYPVENVLEWLASGMTTEEILADYEDLEREDILAALSYAARLTHVKRLERFPF